MIGGSMNIRWHKTSSHSIFLSLAYCTALAISSQALHGSRSTRPEDLSSAPVAVGSQLPQLPCTALICGSRGIGDGDAERSHSGASLSKSRPTWRQISERNAAHGRVRDLQSREKTKARRSPACCETGKT